MNKKKEKLRAQVKSRCNYIFWGAATVSVFAGQILVASGFRRLAESFEKVLDTPIELELGVPRLEFDHKWEDHPMLIK